jgi:hypothetical protein
MSRPLTQATLDRMQCDDPNCAEDHGDLHMIAACHPGAGVDVAYCKIHGVLNVFCHKCDGFIAAISVAASHGSSMPCRHQ